MKKIYSTPEVTLHKYDLSALMVGIEIGSTDATGSDESKGAGTSGGGIDWDAFDNDTED